MSASGENRRRFRVLLTPEAFPMSGGATALRITFGATGSAMEMLTLATIIGMVNWPNPPLAWAMAANHANPMPCITTPSPATTKEQSAAATGR